MTRRMYDASSPPPDPHLEVCAFYIGGDTPHVWTDAEIAAQSARWRLPIYVCDNPAQRNATADAAQAVAWLRSHHVPAGSALGLDYETAKDPSYLSAFDAAVTAAGWTVVLYGSLSSVTQNPRPSAGYWTASWTGEPHLDAGAAATQYASDTQLGIGYDLSEVSDGLVLWDTHDPAPDPVRDWRNDMHIGLTQAGAAEVFTPPAAVLGGTCTLVLSNDFGSADVRVAIYSFAAKGWSEIQTYTVASTAGATAISLTGDANKVSVVFESGDGVVGVDVY